MKIILDLDLLLDFRGLQFCLMRTLRDIRNEEKLSLYGR